MTDRQRQVLDALTLYAKMTAEVVGAGKLEGPREAFGLFSGASVFASLLLFGYAREKDAPALKGAWERVCEAGEDVIERACHDAGWKCCVESGCTTCHPVG